jgi:hypothetical protein
LYANDITGKFKEKPKKALQDAGLLIEGVSLQRYLPTP